MGLLAHYRMEGDLNDATNRLHPSSISSVTYIDGKLGKALSGFNSSQVGAGSAFFNAFPNMHGDFSIAFWIKPPSVPVNTWKTIIGKRNSDSINELNFRFSSDGVSAQFYYGSGTAVAHLITFNRDALMPPNEWTHIVILRSFSRGVQQIYKNGELFTSGVATTPCAPTDAPFRMELAYDMGLDDVRIYDHALSLQEIKTLSQGLMLHAEMDVFQEPTVNLIQNSNFKDGIWAQNWGSITKAFNGTYKGSDVVRVTATTEGNCGLVSLRSSFIAAGETVTLSFDVRSNVARSMNYTYLMRDSSLGNSSFYTNIPVSLGFTRVSATITNSTASNCGVLIGCSLPVGDWFEFTNVQLERKTYATPYTPDSRDGLVADASGQGFNGILALDTTPRWISDVPYGQGGYVFSEGDVVRFDNVPSPQKFTLSLWVKPPVMDRSPENDYRRLIACGTQVNFLVLEESRQINLRVPGVNGDNARTPSSIDPDAWTQVVAVYDQNKQYVYFNGVLEQERTIGPGTVDFGSYLQLSHPSTQSFDGAIADFRLYAEALSAEAVQRLYKNRAALDAQGSLLVPSFKEKVAYQHTWIDAIGFTWQDLTDISVKGSLIFTSTSTDPRIMMYGIGTFDPHKYKFLQFKYRVRSGNALATEIYFTNTNKESAHTDQRVTALLNSDGQWHVATVDMGQHALWTHSEVTGWRFDPATQAGVTMEIQWIRLVESPSVLSISSATQATAVTELGITQGMMAYLPLRYDTKDYSKFSRTVDAGEVTLAPGGLNGKGAIQLDSLNTSRIIINHPPLTFSDTSVTMMGWFMVDSDYSWNNIRYPGIITNGEYGGSFGIGLLNTNNRLYFQVRSPTTAYSIQTPAFSIERNKLYFMALVYDHITKKMRAHLNGYYEEATANMDGHTSQGQTYLGGSRVLSGGTSHTIFKGKCSEVKIFNRALDVVEINQEYQRAGVTKMSQGGGLLHVQEQIKEV